MTDLPDRIEADWWRGRTSLGAASGWTPEEMRLVADLGYALAEQGRHEEATEIFAGLAALAPATAYFQSALGALKLRAGEMEEARAYLNTALALDPRDLAALANRGEVEMRLGNTGAAVRDLRAALQLAGSETPAPPSVLRARALLTQLTGADPSGPPQ